MLTQFETPFNPLSSLSVRPNDKQGRFHRLVISPSAQRFIGNSVCVFRFAKSACLLPQILSCGWCSPVLLLWQRLILSLNDGAGNQMRLWSGGWQKRHKQTVNEEPRRWAFVPPDGCWGCGGVRRDAGEICDGFDVESFIPGSAPKAPRQQHVFSCCLAVVALPRVRPCYGLSVWFYAFPRMQTLSDTPCVDASIRPHLSLKGSL